MKPVFARLRGQGFMSVGFIDDIYLQGDTYEECKLNVEKTRLQLQKLGFLVHPDKSEFVPKQKLSFLGFEWDSHTMSVAVNKHRALKVKQSCDDLLAARKWTIRELSQVIGQIVACFPGVLWGPLYYRTLEREKTLALKYNKGDFDSVMTKLSKDARKELLWWSDNIESSSKPIQNSEPDLVIQTDASMKGFGGTCCGINTSGRWTKDEKEQHINVLELLAVDYALKAFEKSFDLASKHVRVLSDNTCAVTYVNNMGGSKSMSCNKIAHDIWIWCQKRKIWLSMAHIPGKTNIVADKESRCFNDDIEWKLDTNVFKKLCLLFGKPEVDMFATRLNYQIKPFVSWKPDPECMAVDAFTIDWKRIFIYAFPPFSIIQRVLSKWAMDRAGFIIVPMWPTAAWFPQLLHLLIEEPVLLPRFNRLLYLEESSKLHPLHRQLQLAACRLSGNLSEHKAFVAKLQTSSWRPGVQIPKAVPVVFATLGKILL
jgi:hypothetical protein